MRDPLPAARALSVAAVDYDEVSAQLGELALDRYIRHARMRVLGGVRMGVL
jgi:hypothetical protein